MGETLHTLKCVAPKATVSLMPDTTPNDSDEVGDPEGTAEDDLTDPEPVWNDPRPVVTEYDPGDITDFDARDSGRAATVFDAFIPDTTVDDEDADDE